MNLKSIQSIEKPDPAPQSSSRTGDEGQKPQQTSFSIYQKNSNSN
jgi:hypothetical protein